MMNKALFKPLKGNKMKDENEWLSMEIKFSRVAISASQGQIAAATGLSVQSIKRLERKGANPRYKTIENLKAVFKTLGVQLERQDTGINIHFSEQVLKAIETGTLSELTTKNINHLEAERKAQEAKHPKADKIRPVQI